MPAIDVTAVRNYAMTRYPSDTVLNHLVPPNEAVLRAHIQRFYAKDPALQALALALASV